MLKDMFKNYIYPVAVFCGGMVGVGFLSLPYITMKVGIWTMLFYFVVITALVLVLNLIFCQISLKTPDFKRFPGFAGFYLGKWAKAIMMLCVILGTLGVLLAYLLVGSQFVSSAFWPGGFFYCALVYFVLASIIIYFDIKVIKKAEFWILTILILSLALVFAESFSQIKLSNIFVSNFDIRISNFFLPYGALLFSLWGMGLIPEVEEMLGKNKKNLKRIVVVSTVAVAVLYFLFAILVLSITGVGTTSSALVGLSDFLPNWLFLFLLFSGALATFGAFITHGIILKKTLMFDLKIKHWQAFVMTCFTPMVFLLLGFNSFIALISFIGGVLLGVEGILIMLVYKKIGGKIWAVYPLSIVFLLGVIYEIIYFVK